MATSRCPGYGFVLTTVLIAVACISPREALPQAALQPTLQPNVVQWNGIDRVVAFADVHGAYTELLTLLRETGIVDAQAHWAAGHTHVVSLGDLLDRGADSRKVMDLLMRLQGEALAAGGQLHVVLGNHEAMNVLGDLRYVDPGEFASYTDLEPDAGRVDQKHPPGYAGHRAAFEPRGKYGQWLLALPVAIRINDTLFMHAGPGNSLQGMSLQELNLRYRTALADYVGLAAQLEQAKLLQSGDDYDARPRLARNRLAAPAAANAGTTDAALSDLVQRFEAAAGNPLLSESGPNWYRGAALCNEATESDVLLPLLQQFGATRLVVGHTTTRDSRAATRFDGRVVKLDAGMNRAVYRGRGAALIIQPSGLSVRYSGEPDATPLKPEGLFVAPNELEDAIVMAALRDGDVTVVGPRGPNELDVSVSHGGKRIPAVFQVQDAGVSSREVAAYRLDRLMGLGIVPVTVEREVQGQRGVLQGRPLKWVTQADVQQQKLRGGGWCSTEPQFQLMYAFDTLTGNEGRTADSILIDSDDWFVYATKYGRAFGTTRGLPAYLKARPPTPGAEVRRRFAALDEAAVSAALGDQVDSRGRAAILARRDALLALPAAAAKTP
jgi:hypothetical protein